MKHTICLDDHLVKEFYTDGEDPIYIIVYQSGVAVSSWVEPK